ncbi:MAG: hypothetical protein P1P85_04795 [Patescibacteria group bacterium]|nr:hypothetical protein [Patescibacteria group bacterium]
MEIENSKKEFIKPILAGVAGMLALVIVYWLILYLSSGNINHPWQQFVQFKYWISALVLGFGIQFSLYWYVKSGMHLSSKTTKTAVVAGATTSSVSMVACCAHHIFDILPLLGLSAFALFLSKYQTHFFALGIISNLIGIYIMLYIIKHKKAPKIFNKIKFKKNGN